MRREKPVAGPLVVKAFEERERKALQMIIASGIEFHELGVFGSYARNDYKATSDIDILAIVDKHPPCDISGKLREELDMIGVDLVYGSYKMLTTYDDLFSQFVRNDYIRRVYYDKQKLLRHCN